MPAAAATERRRVGAAGAASDRTRDTEDGERPASRAGVVLLVVVFVALQATNNAAVSVMSLFVTRTGRTPAAPPAAG